ncbi:guanine deaminase [Azotosporobacter soli]|uniref:guanine deaminase n=1 Tax=Azotosporobacter soli TaxID=3055040 RepID=UPI0031FE7815
MSQVKVIKGNLIYAAERDAFTICPDHYLILRQGRVQAVVDRLPQEYEACPVEDFGERLIIPGLVDLHTHGAQFNQRGLGMDLQLLEWLEQYTFKEEARFADLAYAASIYEAFATELIRQGTTRAVIFGTIHAPSCDILCEVLKRRGIGAYVGKVNMDANCGAALQEDTQQSLRETEEFLLRWSGEPLVKPILTPRFAVTSTPQLLEGLGKLALRHQVPVQSHLSENMAEVRLVAELFPAQGEYHAVYDNYQLFGQTPTIMAHCIHLTDSAVKRMCESGVVAVHCPDSNLNLASGIMPTRRLLEAGVTVGLGTDIGAGHTLSMLQTMRSAIQMSKIQSSYDSAQKPLTLPEVFYLATKGGGRFFGKVGSFEPGYEFDALVIEDTPAERAGKTLLERLQQFIYTGNPGNIIARYAAGSPLK